MGGFSIGIRRWEAWATHFGNLPEQRISAERGNLTISHTPGLQPASVKPMLRRRLSPLGRTAVWCAEQVAGADNLPGCACVFASQHGEVARTTDILETYNQTGEISPTAFSLSVHNAVSGIYSIANDLRGNITAIAAGEDTLMMALQESASIMQSNTVERILCVVYDQPIPEVLNRYQVSPDFGFAIALLLDKSFTHRIFIEGETSELQHASHPFSFLVSYLLEGSDSPQKFVSRIRSWRIQRCQGRTCGKKSTIFGV